ncbi:hypothetical protein MUG84_12210 [Paenibacillus sp. KQZ6P-2]|uniref:Prenylated flavin chaperone LpdD-like domain-containing protein n=1 Tax=Paenibacillus mangrovi TaxID=2931978 RepID=A0A9X2B2P1_9BACL|nr:hypothetical protein [Paenibacillus mangrovi]MCJ8012496.1 hypothetical protein [Paenibacillus mangrovi]
MESDGTWGIRIQEILVGRDLMLILTGGSAHIGSVSTAYINEKDKRVEVQTVDLPGHREHDLTVEMAEKAAAALGRTVTVAAGIHYDGINREQILEIVSEAKSVFERYLAEKVSESK